MTNEEKELLKELTRANEGFRDVFSLRQNQKKATQLLIAKGLAEEFQHKNISCYRATEKGYSIFYPLHKKLWFVIKGDVKTIIVSLVTALLTTIIISQITKQNGQKKFIYSQKTCGDVVAQCQRIRPD